MKDHIRESKKMILRQLGLTASHFTVFFSLRFFFVKHHFNTLEYTGTFTMGFKDKCSKFPYFGSLDSGMPFWLGFFSFFAFVNEFKNF